MIDTLNAWDHQLMLMLNGDAGYFWDQLWFIYSGKFTWIPLYVILLWQMVERCRKNTNLVFWRHLAVCVFCTILVIVIADQLASGLIKPLVCRPRPSHEPGLMELLHYVNDYRGGRYGFVSSHASNTIAVALWMSWLLWDNTRIMLSSFQKRWASTFRWLLIFWALFNCYSRIYLGVHYPGDILGGLFVGWISFIIVKNLYVYLIKRIRITEEVEIDS